MMLKRAKGAKDVMRGRLAVADVPYSLAAGGFLLAIAAMCAVYGTSFVDVGDGGEARALFFVLLVGAVASLVRWAVHETA